MRYVVRLIALLCGILAGSQVLLAQTEKRVALVIGNGSYSHIAGLPNVPNDAAAMAALFKAAKFDSVEVKSDLGIAELRRALKAFAGRAADADVAVLFYAGHGIEVGQVNYLIPVDARLVTDFDVEDETVPLDRVLQAMEPAKRLRLVLLDACRENPFLRSMKRTVAARSVGRGLGRIEPSTTNTLIAYATKPNAIAEDGKGANSPFTAALVRHLLKPGLDLRIVLGHVRDEVLASTASKQEPYVTGSLGGGIVSIVGEAPKPGLVATPQPQSSEAERDWAAVRDTSSVAMLEVFVARHKGTFQATLAEARIAELKEAKKLAVVTPPLPKMVEPAVVVAPDAALTPGRVFRDCDECPEMVVIPAGSFMMGSPQGEEGRSDDEGPQHKVTIARPFAVGKFEVTFEEWDSCVAAASCKYDPRDGSPGKTGGRRPVIWVSWNDITKEYLPWLSRKTGKTYRLLTEAEWEYVARAGTTTPFSWGSSISTDQANYRGSYTYAGGAKGEDRGKTMPVDSFAPNPWGLHNVHGNVWELVQDCWNASHAGAPSDGSAWITGDCNRRVMRGGSWLGGPRALRSAFRTWHSISAPVGNVGFRVGRTL